MGYNKKITIEITLNFTIIAHVGYIIFRHSRRLGKQYVPQGKQCLLHLKIIFIYSNQSDSPVLANLMYQSRSVTLYIKPVIN